jgi:hypothetical protein
MIGTVNSGSGYIQQQRFDGGSATYNLLLQPNGGNVGIGSSSPVSLMHLSSSSPRLTLTDTDTGADHRINADSGAGNLAFDVDYNSETASPSVIFNIKGSEAVRINSGNVLVGKTAIAVSTDGIELNSSNYLAVTRDGDTTAYFNRRGSSGSIIDFRASNTSVGSIGSVSGVTIGIDGGGGRSGLQLNNGYIGPRNNGALTDNAVDLGSTGSKFKDAYLSGGVSLGGTGSLNNLDDYEEGEWTPVISDATSGGNLGSYAGQSGYNNHYVRVGTLVTVRCRMTNIVTTGMGTGNIYVQGLPFVADGESVGSISVSNYTPPSNGISIAPVVENNDTYISLKEALSNSNRIIANASSFTSGTADIYFTISYETDG